MWEWTVGLIDEGSAVGLFHCQAQIRLRWKPNGWTDLNRSRWGCHMLSRINWARFLPTIGWHWLALTAALDPKMGCSAMDQTVSVVRLDGPDS